MKKSQENAKNAQEQTVNSTIASVTPESETVATVTPGTATADENGEELEFKEPKDVLTLAVADPSNPPEVKFVAKGPAKERKEVVIIPFGMEIRPRIDETFIKGACDPEKGNIAMVVKFDYTMEPEEVHLTAKDIATYTLFTVWADRLKGDLFRQGLDVFNHLIEHFNDYSAKVTPSMRTVAQWAAQKPEKDYFPDVHSWSSFTEALEKALGAKGADKFHAIWTAHNDKFRSGRTIAVHYIGDSTEKLGALGSLYLVNFNQNEAPMLGTLVAKSYGMAHFVTSYEYFTLTKGTKLVPVTEEDFRQQDIEALQRNYSLSHAYTIENQSMVEGYVDRKKRAAEEKAYRENEMLPIYDSLIDGLHTLSLQIYAQKKDGTVDTTKPIKSDADVVETLRAYRLVTLEHKLSKELREAMNAAIRELRDPAEQRIKAVEKAAKEAAKAAAEKAKAEVIAAAEPVEATAVEEVKQVANESKKPSKVRPK